MILYKKKIEKFIMIALVIFLIFSTDSSMWFSTHNNKLVYLIIIFIVVLLASLILYLLNNKIRINNIFLLILIILMFSILFSMLFNDSYSNPNFFIISCILISLAVINIIDKETFIKTYVYTMLVISLYSLFIMWIIVPYGNFIKILFPTSINDSGLLIRNYFLTFHFENHIAGMKRNTGLFREMGVYQHFLNIALIFLLYSDYFKKNKIIFLILLSVTVITTYSSTGYLFLILILLSTLFYKGDIISKNKLVYLIFIITIAILSQLLFLNNDTRISHTITRFSEGDSSYDGRTYSIVSNLKTWSESPIIGHGIEKADRLALEKGLKNFTEHNTSTTTSYFSFYGVVPGIIFLYLMFKFSKEYSQNIVIFIFIFIGLILTFNSQRFNFDILSTLFLFSSYMHKEINNEK
ncbi:hypothetical protein CW674_08620 [Macrococcoides caseolyticum]|uniref:O-antigen ligase family protein n=1 Tax=Macrococcoides caseolyticum TaxID=69966 RepID=UPI000C34565B|nr:O-antigen ligase family protein [Macrococcus caseolyticus]PKE65098.1 hypothetical protein CW674_08620 [Macrococcus caseolyticus]